MKHKQVRIAGNNMCGASANGKGQEFVILRIAAGSYLRTDIDPLNSLRECCEEMQNIPLVNVAAESLAMHNLGDFSENFVGLQDNSKLSGEVECHSRSGIRKQQCAHEHVRIEYEAQSFALQN
jgi:hypothetical protein